MRRCSNCRFGDPAKDGNGVTFYFCRWEPPRSEFMGGDGVSWLQPPMAAHGWCGQFKLAFWRWLKSFVRRGT